MLSLACLLLYGRYISDTLVGGPRDSRRRRARASASPLTHKRANQHLLARLLRRKAEILEIPVQFFPISPERVKRTSVFDGLQALGALMAGRLRRADRDGVHRPGAPRSRPSHPTSGGRLLPPPDDTEPILIIPAAGPARASQTSMPKFLVPVNGRPMIDRLIDLYRPYVSRDRPGRQSGVRR